MGSSTKFRLSTVFILPLVLEVLATAGLVGFFSFRNGQKAVNDLANQLLAEVNVRIEQQVDHYLDKTRAVDELNLRAINMGLLDLRSQNFDMVAKLFWNQVQTFDVTYIGFTTPQDDYIGAGYYEKHPDIAKAIAPTNDTLSYFSPDELGQPTNEIQTQPLAPKHSEQPFYQLPVAARKTVWIGVTNWNTEPNQISIDLATPIYDSDNQLQGVLTTTVSLSFLSDFLRSVRIGKTGQAFIMERSGKLVATSSTEPSYRVVDNAAEQISASDSSEPLVQSAAIFMAEHFGGLQNVHDNQSLSFEYQGQRQFLLISPYTDEFDLDWLIVTVIPEQDFLAQIQANTYRTLLLCIGASILAIAIGLLIARRIARPMLNMTNASAAIASGDLSQQVSSSQIKEIDQLASAFNSMAKQLQTSFTTLEEQNEKLKRLDQLKDEFLANTSHELRNPLNGMIGIAESMIDGATGKLTEIQTRNLWMVAQSGHRLSNLVNDILDFSKLKHKGIELQLKPVSVRDLVEVVLTLSQSQVGVKPLTLINNVSPDLPAAEADEDRLQQILYNLIGNAIKFTPSGTVTVFADVVASADDQEQEMLAVTVADTGIGIAEDKLERIFEAFEQADGATAREYGGTGLGLAVTQQF